MNRKQCIKILNKELNNQILDLLPSELIEAMAYAADFLETHPERGSKRFFFTFGNDPKFPFGIDDFVEVHADTGEQAAQKFKVAFPCRPGSTLLNCASMYNEKNWKSIWEEDYAGKGPAVVID